MDIIFAPWRSQYIETFSDEAQKEKEECFICGGVSDLLHDKERLIIARTKHSIVLLNRYPYNGGHLLIAPKRHIGDFLELNQDEMLDMMNLAQNCVKILNRHSKPQAFNIGMNIGREAGAGLPGHLHLHIIPRWSGDTGFVSTICDVKIISKSLIELQEKYTKELNALLEA